MDQTILLALLLCVIAGTAVAFQGAINALLTKTIGIWEANFIVHFSGALVLVLLLMFGLGQGGLTKIAAAPKISLTGGLLGVIIVSSVIYAISKLGVSTSLAMLIFAQLVVAGLIDHYGWLGTEQIPFSLQRGLAIGLMLLGVFLMKK